MKLRVKYDRKDNNCQHFVKYLANRIRHTGKKIATGEHSRVSMSSLSRGEQNPSPVSRRREAESLLYKPDTGSWVDETQRQTEVHLAMQDYLFRYLKLKGWAGCVIEPNGSLTVYYQDAPGPLLPVWLQERVDRKQWFEDVLLGYVFRD
jgi:hypothetical protein